MPLYKYQALDKDGNFIEGFQQAEDEYNLYLSLKERGFTLVKARIRRKFFDLFESKVEEKILAEFFRHLAYIVRSGIPILTGISDIQKTLKNKTIKSRYFR